MTISSSVRRAGPYATNGVQTSFPFAFKVFEEGDVQVTRTSASVIDQVMALGTDYHVALNADQEASPGGVVTTTSALSGFTIFITSAMAIEQPAVFTNTGGFYPRVLNDSLDRRTIVEQQLAEDARRAVVVARGGVGFTIPGADARAEKALFFDAAGNVDPISVDDFAAPAQAAAGTADMLLAAIIAVAAGFTFDTSAAGVDPVTGVAVGEYFTTWESSRVRLYLNNAGAAVEKAEFATKAMLDALVAGVGDDVLASVTADLAAPGGSALVGFIQNLTNATARTGQTKLRDVVSPEDFGAVGDGVADDTTAIVNAINSGRIVDGNGKTYALGTPAVPGGNVKGIRNCNFKWANVTAMAQQQFMLSIIDKSRIFVENCTFDLGTVEDCGSADDSGRGALKIASSNIGVTYCDYIRVSNCRVSGYGNGTGYYLRSLRFLTLSNSVCHDRLVSASPDPANDCQNGFDVTACKHVTVTGCISRDQQTRLAGSTVRRFSRGFLFAEVNNATITGCVSTDLDQGFDFSGAITATLTEGNSNIAINGCSTRETYTYGFKFANCAHDIAVTGCVAERFGFCGFVISSPNTTPLDATKNTQRITFTGCYAFNPTGAFNSNNSGFRLMQGSAGANYPRGIKFVGCHVWDGTGGANMPYGFLSDVTYDAASQLPNEITACSSRGHVTGATSGFTYTVAQLPSSAPPGTQITVSDSNSTTFNAVAAGGGTNNVSVRFNSNTNDWRIG